MRRSDRQPITQWPYAVNANDPILQDCAMFLPLIGHEGLQDVMSRRWATVQGADTKWAGDYLFGTVPDQPATSGYRIQMTDTPFMVPPHSFAGWFYWDTTPSTVLFGNAFNRYVLFIDSANIYTRPEAFASISYTINTGRWYHLCVLWKTGDSQEFFVNGVSAGTTSVVYGASPKLTALTGYDLASGNLPLDGRAALCGQWTRELTTGEIARLADPARATSMLRAPSPPKWWFFPEVATTIPSTGLAIGSAALRTTAGTQDLTLSGFGTPKGIIIWAGKATTSKTAVDGASWAYASANDSGEIQRAAFYAEHAADPTNSWRNLSYTSLTSSLVMLNNTGGAEVAVTVDSDDANAGPITDGWRVDVTTAPASGYQIIFLLIGGDSDIDVFDIAASNTDLSYGITPQAIYSVTNGNIASNTSANDIIFGQGFSDGTNNAGTLMSDEDNEATTLINGRICSDAAVGQIWSGGLTWRSSLGSFQSSAPQGLVTTTGTPGTDHLNTTAFTLPTGWRAWVGVIDSPTSAASDWVVAPAGLAGITPQLVMISPGMMTAVDTNDATNAAGTFGIALHDSVNARCLGCSAEDAAAAENVQTLYAAQWIYWADATGSVAFDINPSSNPFEVGGWTVAAADIATADSTTRKWPVLVLGTVSGGGVAHGMLLTGVGV